MKSGRILLAATLAASFFVSAGEANAEGFLKAFFTAGMKNKPAPEQSAPVRLAAATSPAAAAGKSAAEAAVRQNPPVLVYYQTGEKAGTVIVHTGEKYLFLVRGDGTAIRYPIAVAREGFDWKGSVEVGRKAKWPAWTAPKEMIARRPDMPRSMKGGPGNPLGARAIYLYEGGNDTLYRIHGTSEPWTIGQAVSSGCIRMYNADVAALYESVGVGAKVIVR